jgi:phage terminase large subunit GpA-like protein
MMTMKKQEQKRNKKQLEKLRNSFADTLLPPDDLTIDEWSDRHRALPRVSSSEQGQWRTSRFPFLKEIMQELSPSNPRQRVAIMKGAQLGFTEIAINWMFYTVDHSPAPFLYVSKTLDMVETFSKQRFGPSVEVCTKVKEKLKPEKSRDSGNTIRKKNFPGGIIIMGGANSASSLRMMPIERLVLDEEDSYEQDIEGEGSPSDIAIRRTANFPRRKILHISTPAIKELSRIEPMFEEGDQRRYYVPCPHCKQTQIIWWRNIKYTVDEESGNVSDVYLECEHCQKAIPERYKTWMLEQGEWVAKYPGRDVASFHISSLYSPIGFYSWKDAAKDWTKAQKNFDRALLKVFINTILGETWTETNRSIEGSGLHGRREHYTFPCPEGVLVLSAGADVQEDRIECEVVGWGTGQENWSIEYAVFRGDTESSFVWEQLDQFLMKTWMHPSGHNLNIACAGIDSGFRARVVYKFCLPREFRRIFPVKGYSGFGKGLISRPKKRNEDGVYLFDVYVDEMKSKIYSQLMIDKFGPGFCHFPTHQEYDQEYFRMLTAEQLVPKLYKGRKTLQWVCPQGRRNEALDARGYAIAALNILNPNFELLGHTGPLVIQNKPMIPKKTRVVSRGVD